MTTEEQREHDRTMAALDQYITDSVDDRRITKALADADDDEHHGEAHEFPPTRAGLAAFAKSSGMQRLLRDDPEAFRQQYLNFCLDNELVKSRQVTPTELSEWSHRLSLLPGIARRGELSKAVTHADAQARPWDFEPTARGLAGFLHSDEMKQLQRERPALWRRLHLDFFAATVPPPSPQDISIKRQELELLYPDDATRSTVAKALAESHRLTSGQSVLVQNFGAALGDPAQWLRS